MSGKLQSEMIYIQDYDLVPERAMCSISDEDMGSFFFFTKQHAQKFLSHPTNICILEMSVVEIN